MASFLDIIDFSIVQVALPTIRTQFLATYADLQWVIGAYGLTLAGFLMLMGRAGDVYGQKKIFIAGIVLFTIAPSSDHFQGIARNRSRNVNGYGLRDFHSNISRRPPKKQGARGSSSCALGRIRSRGRCGRSADSCFWMAFSNVRQCSNWDCGGPS